MRSTGPPPPKTVSPTGWEQSPDGWPRITDGEHQWRLDSRPTAQWPDQPAGRESPNDQKGPDEVDERRPGSGAAPVRVCVCRGRMASESVGRLPTAAGHWFCTCRVTLSQLQLCVSTWGNAGRLPVVAGAGRASRAMPIKISANRLHRYRGGDALSRVTCQQTRPGQGPPRQCSMRWWSGVKPWRTPHKTAWVRLVTSILR